ncbi:MAG: hypothetical protein Q8861_09470 [Bacteroidota bacterium]|nr:hypothetical protein [Bacteroidota bacterium]
MLTLLTHNSTAFIYKLKRIKRKLFGEAAYTRGHGAVTAGITDGLDRLGVEYNINVTRRSEIGDHVHVLSGFEALNFALGLKKKGKIKRLTVGPNVAVSSADEGGIIASDLVDKMLVPSQWVLDAFVEDNPAVEGRIAIWCSGVDPDEWNLPKQLPAGHKRRCLLYLKYPQKKLAEQCKALLESMNIGYELIVYGSYTKDEMKAKLASVDFAIVFSATETQGIALFEMWASDTPTFVWNQGNYQYKLRNYAASSAPYLSEETGCFFRDMQELETLLEKHTDLSVFHPRKWILANGTNEISARSFLNLISE